MKFEAELFVNRDDSIFVDLRAQTNGIGDVKCAFNQFPVNQPNTYILLIQMHVVVDHDSRHKWTDLDV